jgi:RimJ/RimL family protein N-acetyltransferase
LNAQRAKDGRAVSLRPVALGDEMLLYSWQIDPNTRRYARNPQPPTLREHREWFRQRIASPDCVLLIILHSGEPAGCLRLDRLGAPSTSVWEVSINIAPAYHRLGLGKAALSLIGLIMPGAELVAHVMPRNQASHALFRAAGFQHGSDGNYRLVCAGQADAGANSAAPPTKGEPIAPRR